MPWIDDDSVWDSADMWATAEESSADLIELYRTVWREGDAAIAELDLDAPAEVQWWPADRGHTPFGSLVVRVVAETARHAGHADVLRERIDGLAGRDHADVGDAAWWDAHRARVTRAAEQHR